MHAPAGPPRGTGSWEADALLPSKGPPRAVSGRVLTRILSKVVLGPWLIFTISSLLFAFCFHNCPHVLIVFAVLFFAGCVVRCLMESRGGSKDASFALALCALAVVVGSFVGWYNYAGNVANFYAFDERRQYTNLWPDDLAAAHTDASAIVFAMGSKPDVTMSVAYRVGGSIYCVAPIRVWGAPMSNSIQYWAAGRDCCQSNGPYTCDSTRDPLARGGLVITNRDAEFYLQAAKIAAAQGGVTTATQPLFVKWVRDFGAARNDFLRAAGLFWFLSSLACLPVCAVFGLGAPTVLTATKLVAGEASKRSRKSGA